MNLEYKFQMLEQRMTEVEEVLHGEQIVDGKPGIVTLLRDIKSVLYGNAENPGGIIGTVVQVRKTMMMLAGVIVVVNVVVLPVLLLVLKHWLKL